MAEQASLSRTRSRSYRVTVKAPLVRTRAVLIDVTPIFAALQYDAAEYSCLPLMLSAETLAALRR
jgi:hypothetical protein